MTQFGLAFVKYISSVLGLTCVVRVGGWKRERGERMGVVRVGERGDDVSVKRAAAYEDGMLPSKVPHKVERLQRLHNVVRPKLRPVG